jgi:hypothetical protein
MSDYETTYHLVLRIETKGGEVVMLRDKLPDNDIDFWVEYYETYYTDTYNYPDNISAVVVNVFTGRINL